MPIPGKKRRGGGGGGKTNFSNFSCPATRFLTPTEELHSVIFWHINNSKVSYALGLAVGLTFWEMADQRLINLPACAPIGGGHTHAQCEPLCCAATRPPGPQECRPSCHQPTCGAAPRARNAPAAHCCLLRPAPSAWLVRPRSQGVSTYGSRAPTVDSMRAVGLPLPTL